MSTISDVAKLAGVSTMTVSRVINKTGYTSQDTRERVERAIAELGYVPNALARHLRVKGTKTIALILTDITNPFFTTIARGVEDIAREQGFSVMFCNTDESEAEEIAYLKVLLQKQIDGVLLVPASDSRTSLELLQSRQVPVVVLDRRLHDSPFDGVRCDSEQGAYLLTRHLLELGHRRIAVLSGAANVSTSRDRVAGYRRAMSEAGLDELLVVNDSYTQFDAYSQAGGYRMARQLLTASPRPTALFAANNFIAFGAYQALREAGLSVPDDMSLVTFDDLPSTWMIEPFLTAAAQPAYELGRRAAELLLMRLNGAGPPIPQEIVLPTELMIRRSSAAPVQAA